MVWLFVVQQLILQIITAARAVKQTYYMSEVDFAIGFPAFSFLCECAVFSFVFFFRISGYRYRSLAQVDHTGCEDDVVLSDAPIGVYLAVFFIPSDIFVQT